jgi:hypothetical protein
MPVCAMIDVGNAPVEMLPFPSPGLRYGIDPIMFAAVAQKPKLVFGQKAILPDDPTRIELTRSGIRSIVTQLRVCSDERGDVYEATPLKLSGFVAYDQKIARTVSNWRFEPTIVDGVARPACMGVTMIFSLH